MPESIPNLVKDINLQKKKAQWIRKQDKLRDPNPDSIKFKLLRSSRNVQHNSMKKV